MRRLACLALPVAFVAVSCAAPQEREFYINAVNTEEQQIAAVIYVDDDVLLNQKILDVLRSIRDVLDQISSQMQTSEPTK